MYCVYVLYNKKLEKRYIGFTSDLRKRIKTHNDGKVSFTSKGVPWQLVYYEAFCNKSDAQEEERFLKSGKGRECLKHLFKNFVGKNMPP